MASFVYRFNIFTGTFDLVNDAGIGPDPFPQYLLLAGRPGTANDPLISTTAQGNIYGSGADHFGLGLNARDAATYTLGDTIALARNLTTIAAPAAPGSNPSTFNFFDLRQNLTLDTSGGFQVLTFFDIGGTDIFGGNPHADWTIEGAGGLLALFFLDLRPRFKNVPTNPQELLGFAAILAFEPEFLADGAACTVGDVDGGVLVMFNNSHFFTANGGTIAVANYGTALHGPTGDAGVTFANSTGFTHVGVTGGAAVDIDIGFACSDSDGNASIGSVISASLKSNNIHRTLRHGGPGVFGKDQAAFNDSTVLEVVCDPGAPRCFLLSRMSTTDRDAMTATNGMLIYNITTATFQGFQAGAWVDLTGGSGGGGFGSIYAFGG